MRHVNKAVILAATLLLVGCGAEKEHALTVGKAQDALEARFPEKACEHLDEADALARKHRLSGGEDTAVLRCEAMIQQNDLAGARLLAEKIAGRNVPGTRGRARAEEILGKIDIRLGMFDAAIRHLNEADRSYQDGPDRRRVGDLIHLARGLRAYSDGETIAARGHWRSIRDAELRLAITSSRLGAAQ